MSCTGRPGHHRTTKKGRARSYAAPLVQNSWHVSKSPGQEIWDKQGEMAYSAQGSFRCCLGEKRLLRALGGMGRPLSDYMSTGNGSESAAIASCSYAMSCHFKIVPHKLRFCSQIFSTCSVNLIKQVFWQANGMTQPCDATRISPHLGQQTDDSAEIVCKSKSKQQTCTTFQRSWLRHLWGSVPY